MYYPTITPNGYHWRYEFIYQDTLLMRRNVYLKGQFTNYSTYTYSSSRKELTDSLFGNAGTSFGNRRVSTYDLQDRLATYTAMNPGNDTTGHYFYQYGSRSRDEWYKAGNNTTEFTGRTRIDYNPNGTVSGIKYYSPLSTLVTQTNYTYDAAGHLLKEVGLAGGNTTEAIYFLDPVYGVPQKAETYRNGQLQSRKTYFYK